MVQQKTCPTFTFAQPLLAPTFCLELLSYSEPSDILSSEQNPGYNLTVGESKFFSALWFTAACYPCGVLAPQHFALTAPHDLVPSWVIAYISSVDYD